MGCSGVIAFLNNGVAAELLSIYVVNYPLKYFAERIGGDYVAVIFPAPPDVDPAYWIPDVTTITKYQEADLILLNGADYAGWIKKVSLPSSKIINTSKGFKDQYITTKGAVTHSHGPEGQHAHEDVAFTTWLDFNRAIMQAQAIAEALDRKLPQHRKVFETSFAALKKDLRSLDTDLRGIVSQEPPLLFIASHPVYDYLGQAYGLNMNSVRWEPDEMPDTGKWLELERILKDHSVKWMIWEGEPLAETVEKLKTIGVDSLVFSPCANQPREGDFFSVMQQNVQNLRAAYAKAK
jgi:zinc transport system substrate-binding protein